MPALTRRRASSLLAATVVAPAIIALAQPGDVDWDSPTGGLDETAFAHPPSTSRPHAFWFWNGDLTEAELERQLEDMADNGVEEFFIHPRQGLGGEIGVTENTYYLSTDYFDKVGFVLAEAQARGMKAWLYDDLNWPSGFAAGRTVNGGIVDGREVPANPDFVPWYLSPVAADVEAGSTYDEPVPVSESDDSAVGDSLVASLALPLSDGASCVTDGQARGAALDGSEVIELTEQVSDGRLQWQAPEGSTDWCVLHLVQRPLLDYHPDHEPDEPYVDMLNPAVTEKFIEITHETYAGRFGEHFGTTIPGIFNDEPGFYNNFPDGRGGEDSRGSIPWTPGLREYLTDNAGYDLTQELAAIWYDVGPATTSVRVDFYDALSDRYNEAHTIPLARWAENHDIALISNPLVEEDLGSHRLIAGGSWFEMQREYHLPGMDYIGGIDTTAITPKLNSSVAHVFQRARNLSETFGAFGWGLTMEDMKRTNAWLITAGVDLIDNHAFYYSTEGDRAFESPPSQFFQNTFWPRFEQYAELTGRLVEPARGALAVNPVGVLYPSTSVMAAGTPWDVRGFAGNGPVLGPVDESWRGTSNELLEAQLDFDYVDELALAGDEDLDVDLAVADGDLVLGEQRWQALVLPRTAVLDLRAVEMMERLVADGGTVVAVEELPAHEASGQDGELASRLTALFGVEPGVAEESVVDHDRGGLAAFLPSRDGLAELVRSRVTPGVEIAPASTEVRVRHVRREGDDAFLVTNLSGEPVDMSASFAAAQTPEVWDPETGETRVAPVFRRSENTTDVPLELGPYGATWVVFRPEAHDGGSHLTATSGGAQGVAEAGTGLLATLVADEPGEVYAAGTDGSTAYAGSASVTDPLQQLPVTGEWTLELDADGADEVTRPLQSWTDLDPEFSGSGTYSTQVEVPAGFLAEGRRIQLDLGQVHELAAITVNGGPAQHVDWPPYVVDVTEDLHEGLNSIMVTVTNTPANAVEGQMLPSGLLGPVALVPQCVVAVPLEPGGEVSSAGLTLAPQAATARPTGVVNLQAAVRGIASGTLEGTLTVTAPEGWEASPTEVPVSLESSGTDVRSEHEIAVSVPAEATEGQETVSVLWEGADGSSSERQVPVTVSAAAVGWEFESDGDAEGWIGANDVEPVEVTDGALQVTSTGQDPYLLGPDVEVPLAAGAAVEIVMTSSTAGEGQLFWSTIDGGLAEERSGVFEVLDGTHTYTVVVPEQDATLNQLRLDPLRTPGDLALDSIRIDFTEGPDDLAENVELDLDDAGCPVHEEPVPEPSGEPTTPAPTDGPTTEPIDEPTAPAPTDGPGPGDGTSAPGADGELPQTGAGSHAPVLAALVLLMLGATVVGVARQRRSPPAS